MYDECTITANRSKKTASAGQSLANTLYALPLTIALTGELGAGKTVFLQGLASALGVPGHPSSPTYALEQRYETRLGTLLHLDLYRLDPKDAAAFIDRTEGEAPVRVIEWYDRASPSPSQEHGLLRIEIHPDGATDRTIRCIFHDAPLLPPGTVEQWRKDVLLPSHIGDHCDAVAGICEELGAALLKRGTLLRPRTLVECARMHDLLRFIDFRAKGHPPGMVVTPEQEHRWEEWKQGFSGLHHEEACARFLTERGFPVHGTIVATHGLRLPPDERTTIEQKILFYADKRVRLTDVVTLDERFDDFAHRYGDGAVSAEGKIWLEEARRVERELFPDGPPL